LKILILNNDFRVYWKGRLIFLREYLAAYNISLHAVELFGNGSPYAFDTYNNKEDWWTCLFPTKSADDLTANEIAEKLFSVADQLNADIIIGPSIVFYAGALGLRWAKKNNRKFIMFDDGKTSQIKRNPAVQYIKNLLIGQSDAIWLPSPDYDKEYTASHRKNALLFYGFNTIDNRLFKFEDKKTFDHNTIVCVARLVPVKNFDNLLKAWQLVEQAGTNYKLLIIGDGPLQGHLNDLKDKLQLKAITFLGVMDNISIPPWFFKSDAFILASVWESWGLVVNEAMAAGLPVLLSKKINSGESLLKGGVNGFGFDPLDINDMAGAILKYIDLTVTEKESMSQTSLELIDEMSYENMGLQLLKAIQKLNNSKTKSPGIIASLLINRWSGRYNTFAWDNEQKTK
jgi:glycosyltransferase involved in cell wall biosynthesis